jgi:hypothetical protein
VEDAISSSFFFLGLLPIFYSHLGSRHNNGRLSSILGLGRQLQFTWPIMGRVHHGESPTDLSFGVIITSLGGDTLCPAVTLPWPSKFLVRGVRFPEAASRTAA